MMRDGTEGTEVADVTDVPPHSLHLGHLGNVGHYRDRSRELDLGRGEGRDGGRCAGGRDGWRRVSSGRTLARR